VCVFVCVCVWKHEMRVVVRGSRLSCAQQPELPPHPPLLPLWFRLSVRGELGLRGSQLEGLTRELEFTRK
jgi:hypothetical protein